MQKHRAVWKFIQQQHEWLQERFLETSQLPTVLDTPEFPAWVFDDMATENEEEEKEEEEEEIKKKKAGKRKREDERKRKGKKKVTEESEEMEETEEEAEVEELMKDMERGEEEDSEETISEFDSEMELTMGEMLRRMSTEKTQPQQQPPTPPHQTQPPPQTETTPDPKNAESVIFANSTVLKDNLQVIQEEPDQGGNTEVGGSGIPQADATAYGAAAPTFQHVSKEQAESTLQVVLKELKKRKNEEATELLKGLAEASGLVQKTPPSTEAVKDKTGDEEQEKGGPQGKAMKEPETNQPTMKDTAETQGQPQEVAEQSSAVAPGAAAPAEITGATAPPAAAMTTKPSKQKIKKAATRASSRLRSGAKPN